VLSPEAGGMNLTVYLPILAESRRNDSRFYNILITRCTGSYTGKKRKIVNEAGGKQ
jgi:hypothetical protein